MPSRSERIRQLCLQVTDSNDDATLDALLLELQREIHLHISGIRRVVARDVPKWFRIDDSDLVLFQ